MQNYPQITHSIDRRLDFQPFSKRCQHYIGSTHLLRINACFCLHKYQVKTLLRKVGVLQLEMPGKIRESSFTAPRHAQIGHSTILGKSIGCPRTWNCLFSPQVIWTTLISTIAGATEMENRDFPLKNHQQITGKSPEQRDTSNFP